jgi:SAM-dependent methyltransferase
MVSATLTPNSTYVLGHSDSELERLVRQAQFVGDLTAHVFQLAGLRPGMRVLDVGCGAGDVTFLAASIVGSQGEVVGVDKSPEAVALAEQRAAAAGLTNVYFLERDISDLWLDEPVDALVGRLVLMYLADPAVVLRRLAGLVKPGGLIVFHEFDVEGATSEPRCELFETSIWRIKQTLTRAGADIRAGLRLGRIFQEAGLAAPRMIEGARVERGPDSLIYDQVARVTHTLLPLMQRTGVASADEVEIETLAARLREEAVALEATLVSPAFVGAWAQK